MRRSILTTFFLTIIALFTLSGCEYDELLSTPYSENSLKSSDRSDQTIVSVNEMSKKSGNLSDHGGMGGHFNETYIDGNSGGTLEFWNGSLTVSPGSIDESKTIWARTYSLSRGDFFKKIYEFGPSGTTFNPDAVLTLSYCDLGPLPPNIIQLRVYNEETQRWEVTGTLVNNPETKTFTGPISHFSKYSLSGNRQGLQQNVQK